MWTKKPSTVLLHTAEHQLPYTDSPNAEEEHAFPVFPGPQFFNELWAIPTEGNACSQMTVTEHLPCARLYGEREQWLQNNLLTTYCVSGTALMHLPRIDSLNPHNNSMEYAGLIL